MTRGVIIFDLLSSISLRTRGKVRFVLEGWGDSLKIFHGEPNPSRRHMVFDIAAVELMSDEDAIQWVRENAKAFLLDRPELPADDGGQDHQHSEAGAA